MKFMLPSSTVGERLRVLVVGVGGTGSAVLANLAQLAIAMEQLGHPGLDVIAIDDDVVSAANVGRQLFGPADIGLPKAAVLVNRINLAFGLEWRAGLDRFKAAACERGHGRARVIIGCVDSRAGRAEMQSAHEMSYGDSG